LLAGRVERSRYNFYEHILKVEQLTCFQQFYTYIALPSLQHEFEAAAMINQMREWKSDKFLGMRDAVAFDRRPYVDLPHKLKRRKIGADIYEFDYADPPSAIDYVYYETLKRTNGIGNMYAGKNRNCRPIHIRKHPFESFSSNEDQGLSGSNENRQLKKVHKFKGSKLSAKNPHDTYSDVKIDHFSNHYGTLILHLLSCRNYQTSQKKCVS
jgi:hypothetical protein